MREIAEKNKGILTIDKSPQYSSFFLVSLLRKLTGIKKIGHAGTLDPFASGLMILLIGKEFTKRSAHFINLTKEYKATITLGIETDTFDCEGKIINRSEKIPSLEELQDALQTFQGTIMQTPPMFSAKKIQGKKLYQLARKGIAIERKPCKVTLYTKLIDYQYPYVTIQVSCSKGTYIRAVAHDLGLLLNCKAHLSKLRRTKVGSYNLETAIKQADLEKGFDFYPYLERA
jgi:tRNA pseudouridine55 synthase